MEIQNSLLATSAFEDTDCRLFSTRRERPILQPEDIDFEMQFSKRKDKLLIKSISQDGLEHFASNYGDTYKVLYFSDCSKIFDFGPLSSLSNLEALAIDYSKKSDRLWDFSLNANLKVLSIMDSKKLIENPVLFQTSESLEEIRLWSSGLDHPHTLRSLECFRGMKSLKRIDLNNIKLSDKDMDALATLPSLEEFHFDPGMLTTEEIAWICAQYPHLYGCSLRAYDDTHIRAGEVRVCGYRKPTLYLPKQQQQLDKYILQFDKLVAQYRAENHEYTGE